MKKFLTAAALASTAVTGFAATPAVARDHYYSRYDDGYGRDRGYYRDEGYYRDRGYRNRSYRNVYCRQRSGTTGTIVGGALGALLGRELTRGKNYGRNSGTTGAILGAAGGALAGRAIEKGRC